MRKSFYFALGAVVVLISLLWNAERRSRAQAGEIVALQAEISRAKQAMEEARAVAGNRVKEISKLRSAINEAAPARDEPFENALDSWIGKVHQLQNYLEKHPDRRIPQMDFLTAGDWLDVTKEANFDSEASFREKLGTLRGIARQKVSADISKALIQAIAGNGAQFPSSPQALLPYLPAGFNPEILQQLSMNASGKVAGFRDLAGQRFPLVDVPVDDLWDATLFYGENGGAGLRSSHAAGQEEMAKAIAQFTQVTGMPPTSAAQLSAYPGIKGIKPSALDEMFNALTTKPRP